MADGPQGRAETADLLRRHRVDPRRSLGQHFLVDPNIVRKIVEVAGVGPGDRVIEVGAGTGTLTRALAASGASVVAYEVDSRLQPLLEESVGGLDAVDLRIGDVMDADLAAALGDGPWTMVANLPYHVGTPLLLQCLRSVAAIGRFVVMVQREVADRLAAPPGSRVYGVPSVVVGLYASIAPAFRVAPNVFLPPPRVASSVVVLERTHPPSARRERAVEIAAGAFGRRRKMLRGALRDTVGDAGALLEACGLDPSARPETLAPGDFLRLADAEAAAR